MELGIVLKGNGAGCEKVTSHCEYHIQGKEQDEQEIVSGRFFIVVVHTHFVFCGVRTGPQTGTAPGAAKGRRQASDAGPEGSKEFALVQQ